MAWIVDPPSGWQYGFPKQVPDEIYNDPDRSVFRQWLIDNGYPVWDVDFAMKNMRRWKAS